MAIKGGNEVKKINNNTSKNETKHLANQANWLSHFLHFWVHGLSTEFLTVSGRIGEKQQQQQQHVGIPININKKIITTS